MRRLPALLASAAVLTGTPQPAMACVPIALTVIEAEELTPEQIAALREECVQLVGNPATAVARAARGEFSNSELRRIFDGSTGQAETCLDDEELAYAMLDSSIPSPISSSTNIDMLWRLHQRPERLDEARLQNLRETLWLYGQGHSRQTLDLGNDEAVALLQDRWNFAQALARYGRWLPRDWVVLQMLSDPQGLHFDPRAYGRLLLVSTVSNDPASAARHLQAANLVLDPRFEAQDPALAEEILRHAGYYPNIETGDLLNLRAANRMWQQIGRLYRASDDEETRRRGRAIELTGDPRSDLDLLALELSADANIIPEWPEILPEPPWSRMLARLTQSYPSRALRRRIAGDAQVALYFDADGVNQGFRIVQSSGSAVLDEALVSGFTRYFRPIIDTLPPELASGAPTYIMMPPTQYRITDLASSLNWQERFDNDGTIVIGAQPRRPRYHCY